MFAHFCSALFVPWPSSTFRDDSSTGSTSPCCWYGNLSSYCESSLYRVHDWYDRDPGKPRRRPHTKYEPQRQQCFRDGICSRKPTPAIILAKDSLRISPSEALDHSLSHKPHTPFPSVPPYSQFPSLPYPPFFSILPNHIPILKPASASKPTSKLCHPIRNPFPLADERRHPLRVVEESREGEERHNSRDLMQDEERGDVCYGGVEEGGRIAVEETGEARIQALKAGTGIRRWGMGGLKAEEADCMAASFTTRGS